MLHVPHANDIVTPRLLLRLLDFAFLDACLRGRVAEARALLGAEVPELWLAEVEFIARRWQQLRTESAYAPFAPRALLRRHAALVGRRAPAGPDPVPPGAPAAAAVADDPGTLTMVGHCGFHSAPDADYLGEHGALRAFPRSGRMVEIGYTVFAAARRCGYAEEAVRGMSAWAAREHGVRHVVASIAPTNLASQRLAAKLGFARVGGHVDEVDGPEDVLVWTLPP